MAVRPCSNIKANILLNISEIPCYLVNKLWKKQRSTLTVVRDTYILCRTFMYIYMWSFRYVYKLKTIYSSKMVIQYSLPRISLISSYIITNKALILSIFWKQRLSYFPAKKIPHKVRKTEINTAIVSHTCKFGCNILITTETFLINNIWENISELVNITEV